MLACRRRPRGRGGWCCRCSCRPSSRGSPGRAGPGWPAGQIGYLSERRSVKPEQVQVARALAGPRLVGLASPVSARRNFGIGDDLAGGVAAVLDQHLRRAGRCRRCCSAARGWGLAGRAARRGCWVRRSAVLLARAVLVGAWSVTVQPASASRPCGRAALRADGDGDAVEDGGALGLQRSEDGVVDEVLAALPAGGDQAFVGLGDLPVELGEVAVDLVEGLVGHAGQLVAYGRALDLRVGGQAGLHARRWCARMAACMPS